MNVRALEPSTWPDFAALVERHNGVWGGCWCMGFHPEGVGRHKTPAINRAEKEDLPIFARQEQARPGGAALGVVGPLHLVEHEELACVRRHLHRRTDHGRVLVDPFLAGDEPDVLGSDPLTEPSVCFLGKHPERPGIDAGAFVGELAECRVRLP